MIRLAIWLLVIAAFIYGIYCNYKRSAALIKRHIDGFCASATAAYNQKDAALLERYHEVILDYGRQHCVDRPWFGLYEYFTEADIHVANLRMKLRDEEATVSIPKPVTRGRGIKAYKV